MRKLMLLLVVLAASPAFAKSLYWDAMDVRARLDANGRLHVREVLTYVFDGDWNGGERAFLMRDRQQIVLDGVYRVDGSTATTLTAGTLEPVDGYTFEDDRVRFRSRLASDPPFSSQPITYEIDYTISNVLLTPGAGQWVLNHDFAFADRPGVINNFTLTLELDPVWTGAESPIRREAARLPQGSGFTLYVAMGRAAGAAPPASVVAATPLTIRYGIIAGILGAIGLLTILFHRAELPTGRFDPIDPASAINEEWLTRHVFHRRAEVIGAAWDGTISAPEVAAVLARLTAEGKIKSRVEGKVLHMDLLCERSELTGYDAELVEKLFFDGSSTDTDKIRKRYEKTGFNPSSLIEPGIKEQLSSIPEWDLKVKRTHWLVHLPLLLAAGALLFFAASEGDAIDGTLITRTAFLSFFASIFMLIVAAVCARALRYFGWIAFALALTGAPLVINAVAALLDPIGYSLRALIACSFVVVVVTALALDVLRIPEHSSRIAYRKKLLAARNYFVEQLASAHPALKDEWLPYLLAFGLGSNVDKWFSAFSTPDSNRRTRTTSTFGSSGTSSTSSGSSWSGGGGAFGGAGATGSWVAAASVMASGVSTPGSSSSGGGGGSSSSSSSGGGSGGGW